MPYTVNQFIAGGITSSAASFSVTLIGTTAGSIIFVAYDWDRNASGTPTVSDGHGDTFTDSGLGILDDAASGYKNACGCFFAATTGTTTITVSFPGPTNPTFGDVAAYEVFQPAGVTQSQFDRVVRQTGTTNPPTGPSTGTLSSATEVAFAFDSDSGNTTGMSTGGWTFNTPQNPNSGGNAAQVVSATTALSSVWVEFGGSNTNWSAWAVTIMAATAVTTKGGTLPLMGIG